MSRSRKKIKADRTAYARIDSMNHDGRGVAHFNGKAVFVDGGLPTEELLFSYQKQRNRYDEGKLVHLIKASSHRVEPRCAHFGVCGGCSLQHLDAARQIQVKQQVTLDNLKHIGKVVPESVLPPLTGPYWGYRRKARLGVKYVTKKDSVLVGFREKRSPYLAEMTHCKVLHQSVGNQITALRILIASLKAFNAIPQIEVAVGDHNGDQAVALVFRHLEMLDQQDLDKLTRYGKDNNFQIYLQPAGPESVHLLWPEEASLSYQLPDHNIEILFQPDDFTQVNADLNQKMINRAFELLDLTKDDHVLDLYCGLGNFTLPMARRVGSVVGLEGDSGLIKRAEENARTNRIDNAIFMTADLSKPIADIIEKTSFNKVLLDPPRTGAAEVIDWLPSLNPERIVYVSCNPATLARDAGMLVNEHGYRLKQVGVMDMFPHTAHVEAIALFECS